MPDINYMQLGRTIVLLGLLISGIILITLSLRSIYEPLGYLALGISLLAICISEVINGTK